MGYVNFYIDEDLHGTIDFICRAYKDVNPKHATKRDILPMLLKIGTMKVVQDLKHEGWSIEIKKTK